MGGEEQQPKEPPSPVLVLWPAWDAGERGGRGAARRGGRHGGRRGAAVCQPGQVSFAAQGISRGPSTWAQVPQGLIPRRKERSPGAPALGQSPCFSSCHWLEFPWPQIWGLLSRAGVKASREGQASAFHCSCWAGCRKANGISKTRSRHPPALPTFRIRSGQASFTTAALNPPRAWGAPRLNGARTVAE